VAKIYYMQLNFLPRILGNHLILAKIYSFNVIECRAVNVARFFTTLEKHSQLKHNVSLEFLIGLYD